MLTNYFRIDIPFEEFQIQRVVYDEEKWVELKQKYNQFASFFKNDNYIYVSPAFGQDIQVGEVVTLDVNTNSRIVSSLIRHLLFRTFRDAFPDRVPQSFSPLRFFSSKDEHDIANLYLPSVLKGKVSYSRLIEVETRKIEENGNPVFGLLIGSHQKWQMNIKLSELISDGYSLIGKNVIEPQNIAGLEGVIAPEEELLGVIVRIDGSNAIIKTNSGEISRKLENLYLQKSKNQIGDYLEFKMGKEAANQFFSNVRSTQLQRVNQLEKYTEILKFAKWFTMDKDQPRKYSNNDGFCFSVTQNNYFDSNSLNIQNTSLIFDYGPGASEATPFRGISNHGPFNSEKFASNNLRVLAICRSQSRGAMSSFVKRLVDGIPESRAYRRGFVNFFRLASVNVTIQEVSGETSNDYITAIDDAIKESEHNFDIALIECDDNSKSIPIENNPYYNARARLMSYGIPTQGIKNSHTRLPINKVEWILSPLALQIYAKVGGTPWRLPAAQGVDQEIVVGIGNALDRKNLWSGAEQSRIVGITTFFMGDGSYMLGERLKSVPYNEYFDECLKSLEQSIKKISQEYAWENGQTIRIVFHVFKPMKNIEADVVKKLVESFTQYKILFSFVTISTNHPWHMIRDYDGNKNVTLCERGDNIILDPFMCLLQLRGDKDRPNKRQSPPRPVVIRLHDKSTYRDIKYIVQQIHDFSYLSWRSFYPNETPVTVFYSNLIASESNKLNKISGWHQELLDQHFRRKLWFL